MTRYKLLKSSISLEDFEGLLAFLVAEFEFDKNQAKPWSYSKSNLFQEKIIVNFLSFLGPIFSLWHRIRILKKNLRPNFC